MTLAIETTQLTYAYAKDTPLLKDINLRVPQGSIFGFLGKNGSGKTTSLKLILGLLKKQKGQVAIFGKRLEDERIAILKNIGSLIESPSFYGHLSAKDNLRILQKMYECPINRINEVLGVMGLSAVKNKKVQHFSLGMKQRLSIAFSLLHQPSLLILDEPTNGLDPKGIIEIRQLLKEINAKYGTTIIISSHLLSEVEKLVSHLAILNKGQLIFQGAIQDLQQKQKALSSINIRTDQLEKSATLIAQQGYKTRSTATAVQLAHIKDTEIAAIVTMLIEHGIEVYEVGLQKCDLESIFIHLTS